jgi:hypothetical protein
MLILLLCLFGLAMSIYNHNWEAMLAWITCILVTAANLAVVKKYKHLQSLSQNLAKETEKFIRGRRRP